MEEIIIEKIEWSAPEYRHKEKSVDFIWTIGLVALVSCIIALWLKNYLFSVFIFISGACLILFSIRPPSDVNFSIETDGITLGKDKYDWKKIKFFNIKKNKDEALLLIEIDKYLLPIYTIPLPLNKADQVRTSILKVIPMKELEESKSMIFMEKLGF